MPKRPERVTAKEFRQRFPLPGWNIMLGQVEGAFRAGSFVAATAFAQQVAELAEEHQHHPDIQIRYPDRVRISLTTHDVGGLTALDATLAAAVSELAGEVGATMEPDVGLIVEVAIDALDFDAVRPFWLALLGYRPGPASESGQIDSIHDPTGRGPDIWFQQMDEARPQRNRIHIDATIPHQLAEQRVSAAIDAGGTLLSDEYAKAFWVLADPEGNEACICTWQDRSH